jgi:hypothetical protein
MIIIETKKGPRFVNDQAIIYLRFNQEKNAVFVCPIGAKAGPHMPFATDVELVEYVNQSEPSNYIWNGSKVEDLERQCMVYQLRIAHLEEEIENLKHSNPKT